jgi:myosin heavy subunit
MKLKLFSFWISSLTQSMEEVKMAFFGFMKGYAEVKSETAGVSIVQMIAGWDPEGASEADIRVMDKNLDDLLKQASEAKNEADREQREADEINELYRQRLAGIEVLEKRKEGADPATVKEIDAVIVEELDKLEAMQADIAREEQEAKEAAEYKAELDELCKVAADKLKNARKQLNDAQMQLKRANLREKRASEKAARKAELEGITKNMSKMTSALGAMQKKAAEANAKAEAHEMKSKLLNSSDTASSMMADAMKEANKGASSSSSIADRLAALKAKK